MSETPQAKKIRLTVNELAAAVQERDARIATLEAQIADTQALIAAAYEAAVGEVLMPLLSSTLASKEQAYTESFSDAMGERADAIELSIRRIRALTPADARAALDRRDRQMRAEGMREAAEVCTRLALDDASFIIRSRAEKVDAQ